MGKGSNKRYCFIDLNNLRTKDITTGIDYNPNIEAILYDIPVEYQKMVIVINSDLSSSSFWNYNVSQLFEFISFHEFDITKAVIKKVPNKRFFIFNATSRKWGNDVAFDCITEYKTIHDVGKFYDELITKGYYDRYRDLIYKLFNESLLRNTEDEEELIYPADSKKVRKLVG